MSDLVTLTSHGNIAVLTMDDGKANAISPDMIAELNGALDEASEADAVVLAGRPGRFSAGFDLGIMMSGPDGVKGLLVAGSELFMRIYGFDKPVVMAVTGHAIAGGILLAATGDTRIGIEGEFKIGLNEVANGMPVPILAHRLAKDRLTSREFERSVLKAHIYDPRSAQTAGWLDQVVAPESLEAAAIEEAERLSQFSTFAYSMTKKSIRQASIDHIRETLDENLGSLAGFAS